MNSGVKTCPRLKRLIHTSTAYVAWPDAADGLLGEPPLLDAALCERLAKCDDAAPSLPAEARPRCSHCCVRNMHRQ